MLNRRQFLQVGAAGTVLSLPTARFAFAKTDEDARFVFVLLRGGMDGLACEQHLAFPGAGIVG